MEKSQINNPYTQNILQKIKYEKKVEIDNIEDIWGKVKKPYLQKRTNLNLFIGRKKGTLLKEAPPAYGHGNEKHFYFIHAYNCIYECQYCYLQGYFNTPDLVLFVNHDEIIAEMEKIVQDNPDTWFHAGEFSDSLALSHLTDEYSAYYEFFKKYPEAKLELRTKSVNIKKVLGLAPLPNIYTSFTLSSEQSGKVFDVRCPSVSSRLKAIEQLVTNGHRIGIHFDPIIYEENFKENYKQIIAKLSDILPNNQMGYISIGVVRFTKDVYKEVERNYPDSLITKFDYSKSFDGKIRYNRPMRRWIMNHIKELLIQREYNPEKIYFCMEED